MRFLLDTNAYSALARGDEETLATIRVADELLLSVVVTVPVSEVTADRYARIAGSLRRKGTPIPQNDVWIAAQTMEHGANLLSFDKHFLNVDGLILVTPGDG